MADGVTLDYATMDLNKTTMEQPTAMLRWLNITGRLQQRWEIRHYDGASLVQVDHEWRDVPTED